MTLDHAHAIEAIKQALGPKGWSGDADVLAPYLVDERGRYQSTTALLVKPASTEEVSQVLKIAHAAGLGVVPMGGNTGLVGGAVAAGEIIVSLERMNKIEAVDKTNLTINVQAGAILADVQNAAADGGTCFPLSLGAEGSCQIGGNLS
ncbi:MAG: FAD-binding oxidoreductase, partial [Rhodospirillaceae bacterium]|nr:FAD-binding oxidoreductase [Rhodospirillaceae bacterium]